MLVWLFLQDEAVQVWMCDQRVYTSLLGRSDCISLMESVSSPCRRHRWATADVFVSGWGGALCSFPSEWVQCTACWGKSAQAPDLCFLLWLFSFSCLITSKATDWHALLPIWAWLLVFIFEVKVSWEPGYIFPGYLFDKLLKWPSFNFVSFALYCLWR